jgi:hypothetical protein
MDELCAAVHAKIDEQIERTAHLAGLVPTGRLDWKPDIEGAWPPAMLLGHLLDCAAGFCAVLAAAEPDRLTHFSALRDHPVNHECSPDEAVARLAIYRERIREGFAVLTDASLSTRIVTIFVKEGEPLLTLLLGNLEHLINHKHQLFTYLKQVGVNVGTADLYRFR